MTDLNGLAFKIGSLNFAFGVLLFSLRLLSGANDFSPIVHKLLRQFSTFWKVPKKVKAKSEKVICRAKEKETSTRRVGFSLDYARKCLGQSKLAFRHLIKLVRHSF